MGSCTAHAVAGAFEFEVQKQGLPDFSPSRLFIWYNARAKSSVLHATKKNVGSSIREAIKSLNFKEHGVCSESDWPYEVGKYNKKTRYFIDNAKAARKPPAIVEKHAHLHTAAKYRAICAPNLREKLIQCLDQGYPFVFGMHTYGLLSKVNKHGRGLHKKNGTQGHAVMAVGYIQEQEVFIIRNSWGAHWGQNGHFYMPYEYILHCHDFWTINLPLPQ
ncbi:hypothetical protein FOMPIDRAFT_1032686 [Fomitopsis schrenkii]|uniref:Peptidase C1A papain C-terminal domain-containing protein n=1 Tax=Fomitopsis schrenkii TaxID=2126942 RepID=S8FBG2_FOMSC|nr:hypothetical protein FOMPIDRAFT_1032686 [Fomitopsis schrenkii]